MESQPFWLPRREAERAAEAEIEDALADSPHSPFAGRGAPDAPSSAGEVPSAERVEEKKRLLAAAAENYRKISRLHERFFRRVHDPEPLAPEDVSALTLELAAEAPEKWRPAIERLGYHFRRDAEALAPLRGLARDEILARCARDHESAKTIAGEYTAQVTNLSVDFRFRERADYLAFVKKPGDSLDAARDSVGRSFQSNGIPVTAQIEESEDTLKHERQHKLFVATTADRILDDAPCERRTRDELLAFFSERGSTTLLATMVMGYGFWEKYGVDRDAYEAEVRLAVGVLETLKAWEVSPAQIISLLTREPLGRWDKVLDRLRASGFLAQAYREKHPRRKRDKTQHQNEARRKSG